MVEACGGGELNFTVVVVVFVMSVTVSFQLVVFSASCFKVFSLVLLCYVVAASCCTQNAYVDVIFRHRMYLTFGLPGTPSLYRRQV